MSRIAVGASVFAGLLVGGLAVAGLVAFAPDIEDRLIGTVPSASGLPAASPRSPAGSPASPSVVPSASVGGAASPDGSASAQPQAPASAGAFRIGQPAPRLLVPRLGGGMIDLAALHGKPVWVNFMATYCPPCRDEFPLMNGYAARFADKGLVIVAVDVREDPATVGTFADSLNTTFAVGLDIDGSAQRDWGAVALPIHFWIDANGIIRDGALGGLGPDVMAQGLSTILPGVDLTP